MQRLGQLSPISVYCPDDGTLLLVTGLHRLEAAKRLGWDEIDAVFVTGKEIDRELQEIAENLHRSELTALERDTQIGRWAELTAAKASQVETPLGGTQPSEKGVRKVANDLGLDKSDVQRAVKVASISPEAKRAAHVAGLDNNRTALLAVANEATPEAQVAKVGAISSAKTAAKAKNRAAATVAFEPKRPDIGSVVVYISRPGEGRAGKSEFPALVMHHEPDGESVVLLVIYDVDDMVTRPALREVSEDIPWPAWRHVKGNAPEKFEPTRINHIRRDLDEVRERLDETREALYGEWEKPDKSFVDLMASFEQKLSNFGKRLKVLEQNAAKVEA
jgi:ParB-like chromosome segregation protein Spo0J